jgi:hypothetical protein
MSYKVNVTVRSEIRSKYINPYCFYSVTSLIKILPTDITFFMYSHGVYLVLNLAYDVAYTQFRQDHFGLLEDGAPEAPKHVGVS